MFNPSMQTKISGKNNLGLFIALGFAITFGFAFFNRSSITGAAMMDSGEVSSFEPIFIFVAAIIVLILLSLLWWLINKNKKN